MKNSNNYEKSRIVVELQRINEAIKRLHTKLESYLCVPKTKILFEKKEVLKTKLGDISQHTNDLMAILEANTIVDKNYITDVELQFEKFNKLQKEVQEYVEIAK